MWNTFTGHAFKYVVSFLYYFFKGNSVLHFATFSAFHFLPSHLLLLYKNKVDKAHLHRESYSDGFYWSSTLTDFRPALKTWGEIKTQKQVSQAAEDKMVLLESRGGKAHHSTYSLRLHEGEAEPDMRMISKKNTNEPQWRNPHHLELNNAADRHICY